MGRGLILNSKLIIAFPLHGSAGVGLSAAIFLPRKLGKKDFRSIPNASPPHSPTRADYAERERLHCEAIIPNASPPHTPPQKTLHQSRTLLPPHRTKITTTSPPQKRISASKSRVSEGRGRACADYAERERLHCEAIIPNATQPQVQCKISA
ncbi:MAG: hypothetical protein LBQ31_10505 [Bacteroidales bacterium]|nr:hypothetical protein [Bacteroidales bacterium]